MLWSKGYPKETICLSYEPASRKVLVGLDDGVIDFLKVGEGTYEDIVCEKVHTARVNGLCFDSLSNVAYSISQDKLFRVSHGTSLALVQGIPHKEPLLSMWHDPINKRVFMTNKIG